MNRLIFIAPLLLAAFIALGLMFDIVGEDQLRAIGADVAKQHGYLTGRK